MHRSQRDPRAADPDAPQRVLAPAELGQQKGTSERASQSTRAWLEEQDLGGFDELAAAASANAANAAAGRAGGGAGFSDMRVGEDDDYDYGQHLREIRPDGLFIARVDEAEGGGGGGGALGRRGGPGSVVSVAHSAASRVSRLSRASIQLRSVAEVGDAFESAEELAFGVGGAENDMNQLVQEEEEAAARDNLDDELWTALHAEEELLVDGLPIDDDFVLHADRPTELLPAAKRAKKKKAAAAAGRGQEATVDEEEGEGDGAFEQAASAPGHKPPPAAKRVNPFKEMFPSDESDDDEDDDAPRAAPRGGKGGGDGGGRAAAAAPKAAAAPSKPNPFKEMFPSDSDDDDDDDDDAAAVLAMMKGMEGVHMGGRKAGGRGKAAAAAADDGGGESDDDDDGFSTTTGGGRADASRGEGRLLDERFDKLLEAE